MSAKTISVSDEAREYDRGFHAAFSAVRQARSRHVRIRPHRALTPLKVTPYLLAQAVLLPVVLCALLLWAKPLLLAFWRNCIFFWSSGLNLPFGPSGQLNQAGQQGLLFSSGLLATPLPGVSTMVATTALTLAAFAWSLRMDKAMLPLKYPLRIVCVVQAASLMYFWLSPLSFPYSIAHHSEDIMTIGFVVMLMAPVMLAMGYYILNQSLAVKLFNTALILLFLAVMVPHQVLAQAFIMQHLSVLFMPVLYICFGAVFDALVFVALYSWVASNASAEATL